MSKIQKILLGINILITVLFGIYYSSSLNFEFIAYVIAIAAITAFFFGTLKYTKFSTGILLGITIWAVLHMLGGSIETKDGVLYAYKILPIFDGGGDFYILKFDQVVHAFLYGVVGLIFLHLIREILGIKTNKWLVAFIAIFASAGFSIVNEVIEFTAVVLLPETGVGGYYNTVLDLIFNLLGSAIAVVWSTSKNVPRERNNS